MCVEIANNNANNNMELNKDNKSSYSIKKLLRQLFKIRHTHKSEKLINSQNLENSKKAAANSLESLESLENLRNADIESECTSLESYENDANERRISASCALEDYDFADICTVPVHFVRTEHGTFFWTATSDIPADNDLIEPLYCSTSNHIATIQFPERWAQA